MHHFFDYIKYLNDADVSTLFLGLKYILYRVKCKEKRGGNAHRAMEKYA